MVESKSEPKQEKKWYQRVRLLLGVVVILWLITGVIVWLVGNFNGTGELGDTYGILNTLFSGLAFAILIYTANMQREELALQREELTLTREELRKSAEAQNANLEHQRMVRRSSIQPSLTFVDHKLGDNGIVIGVKLHRHPITMAQVNVLDRSDLKIGFLVDTQGLKRPNYEFRFLIQPKNSNEHFDDDSPVFNLEFIFANEDGDILCCHGISTKDASYSSMSEPKLYGINPYKVRPITY